MSGDRINIFQIYYDDDSKKRLDAEFLPLDNTANERPDWYEFWVIRKFLKANRLDEEGWYGFLSPSFGAKTGFTARFVKDCIGDLRPPIEVALFSAHIDWLTYHTSVFEQGEAAHGGLLAASRDFLKAAGIDLNPATLVTDLHTGVFSNYVVARPRYWRAWLKLADQLFDLAESQPLGPELNLQTPSPYKSGQAAMKVFIQERLPSLIIILGGFSTFVPPSAETFSSFAAPLQRSLVTLDTLKNAFMTSGDETYMRAFLALRRKPPFHTRSAGL